MIAGSTPSTSLAVGGSILLWSLLALYFSASLFWTYEMAVLARRYDPPAVEYGLGEVQVRILTIDAERVVQRTVNAVPDEVADCYVIAEAPIDVEGAKVRVVPDEYECEATRKARAIEWARRRVPCECEFVLYLDEDTVVTDELAGMPDADVVQFGERPVRTGSRLAHLAEVFRMGFQLEQRAFPELEIPLYAWGGGLAVRKRLEDRVTWDFTSIIEDTTFTWTAAVEEGIDFEFVPTKFRNQAPPSVAEMFNQRRRWLAGSRQENSILPLEYWLLYGLRNLSWGISPIVPVLTLLPVVAPGLIYFELPFQAVSFLLLVVLLSWSLLGSLYYDLPLSTALVVLALTPLVTVVHSAGALAGLVVPPARFEVTEKVEELPPSASPDRPGRSGREFGHAGVPPDAEWPGGWQAMDAEAWPGEWRGVEVEAWPGRWRQAVVEDPARSRNSR